MLGWNKHFGFTGREDFVIHFRHNRALDAIKILIANQLYWTADSFVQSKHIKPKLVNL